MRVQLCHILTETIVDFTPMTARVYAVRSFPHVLELRRVMVPPSQVPEQAMRPQLRNILIKIIVDFTHMTALAHTVRSLPRVISISQEKEVSPRTPGSLTIPSKIVKMADRLTATTLIIITKILRNSTNETPMPLIGVQWRSQRVLALIILILLTIQRLSRTCQPMK